MVRSSWNENITRMCVQFEFFLNCQQHKVDRSGNNFFPKFYCIKFVKSQIDLVGNAAQNSNL